MSTYPIDIVPSVLDVAALLRASTKVRSAPMVPKLATALAKLSQREHFTDDDDDLVFGNVVGEVEHDNLLRRRYYRALKAAKLPRVRFHDLRHVFGSTAVKAFPLSDVQAMLGHAHITTTMRYVHHRPGKDDAQRLGRRVRRRVRVPTCVPKRGHGAQLRATQRGEFGLVEPTGSPCCRLQSRFDSGHRL
jgi:integrase